MSSQARVPDCSENAANPQGMSFKEPIPALVKRNGYEGHVWNFSEAMLRKDPFRRRHKVPVTGALSSPDRAPSPTCPFIKNQQCQRATEQNSRTTSSPRVLTGGPVVRSCWRPRAEPSGRRHHCVGGAAYMEGGADGQRLFAILLQPSKKMPDLRGLGAAARRSERRSAISPPPNLMVSQTAPAGL